MPTIPLFRRQIGYHSIDYSMKSEKNSMRRLINILEMRMPLDRVGETGSRLLGNDRTRLIVKVEEDSAILSVVEESPERTEYAVEEILDGHNAVYDKTYSNDEMKIKYVITDVDDSTFI